MRRTTNNILPLMGRRIIVTRARKQAGALSKMLTSLGASVFEIPCIKIRDLDPAPIKRALAGLDKYDLVIFTSVNTVEKFFSLLSGDPSTRPRIRKSAAIGRATARCMEENNLHPDIIPEQYTAEGLIDKLKRIGFKTNGARILLPRAKEARMVINEAMESAGAVVHDIPIYETVPVDFSEDVELVKRLRTHFDLVSFTSPSAAYSFTRSLDAQLLKKLQNETPAACIGPITAEAARELGYEIAIIPDEHTIDGLVGKIVEFYRGKDL